MNENILINSDHSFTDGIWSFTKGIAPMVALNFIASKIFSTDASNREKIALTEQQQRLTKEIIGIAALAKDKTDTMEKIQNKIKIIENSELTKNFTIKNILKFVFSLTLFNWVNAYKKWNLKNELDRSKTEYAPIEESFAETEKKIQEIQKKIIVVNQEIEIQMLKKTGLTIAAMIFVLPNLNAIMNTIYPLFGYEPIPTGSRLSATGIIKTLEQNSSSEKAKLAHMIDAACGTKNPPLCSIHFKQGERPFFCRAVESLTGSSNWVKVLKIAEKSLCAPTTFLKD